MPCFIHIMNQPPLQRGDGPIGLFLVPTRELAQQVAVVASTFGSTVNIRNVCVYGGAPKGPQLRDIERGITYYINYNIWLYIMMTSAGDQNLVIMWTNNPILYHVIYI